MITPADIEKAFNEPVAFPLSTFGKDVKTAFRPPNRSEVKARLLALVEKVAA